MKLDYQAPEVELITLAAEEAITSEGGAGMEGTIETSEFD